MQCAVRLCFTVILKAKIIGPGQNLANFSYIGVLVMGAHFYKRISFGGHQRYPAGLPAGSTCSAESAALFSFFLAHFFSPSQPPAALAVLPLMNKPGPGPTWRP